MSEREEVGGVEGPRGKAAGETTPPVESALEALHAGGVVVTRSPEEMFALGRSIGSALEARAVFLLKGDLGAGKTLFTKGLASALGIDPADVTSPSFTLVNVHEGRLRLYHVDLYRLDREACQELGLEEMLQDERGVTVIEWGERLPPIFPRAIRVDFDYLSDTERRITIHAL